MLDEETDPSAAQYSVKMNLERSLTDVRGSIIATGRSGDNADSL